MSTSSVILPDESCVLPAPHASRATGTKPVTFNNPFGVKYLERRSIIPATLTTAQKESTDTPNTENIQGDIYYMFPKKFEHFVFFIVRDVQQFWQALGRYASRITSSATTAERIKNISEDSSVAYTSNQIAFSKAGLMFLNIKDDLGDFHFDNGSMRKKKYELGDRGDWNKIFDDATTHGVFVVAAKTDTDCEAEENDIRRIFAASIASFTSMAGRVRPGDGEHFGWRDGISQPGIEDLILKPQPGQRIVKPGVIIMGYPGDPIKDDPSSIQRPTFCKDGSFMVFRKLEQDVLGFNDYIDRNWKAVPAKVGNTSLTDKQRKDLFGARMVGRFKTGAPLALTPYRDSSEYTDPDRINNFDYTEGVVADKPDRPPNCPFAAHIRKTAPRSLDPFVQKDYLDASMIVRAGIPYGPEVSDEEKNGWKRGDLQSVERGLLFVCYQSSIKNGFYRQTTKFAANDFFPATNIEPAVHGPDPIIGGPPKAPQVSDPVDIDEGSVVIKMVDNKNTRYVVTGVAKKVDTSATGYQQEWWITSRGGEYFFVPSISAIKNWCENPPTSS
ncbi:Dyp-type peroxidase [Clavulina sp. PMI_390]|nr:Dyp-type peroxidase [Clavulina sp. PMI_390]